MLHNLVDVELAFGAVSYKSHVALKYVPKLRHLVEVVRAHPFAGACKSWVAKRSVEQQLRSVLLRVDLHAAKLVYIERLAVQTNALLTIDDRLSILKAYCYIAYEK